MAIESGVANTGSACDVIQARRSAITGEGILGYLKDALAIAFRVRAGFTCRRRWRQFLLWHAKTFLQPGIVPAYLVNYSGTTPVLSGEGPDVNSVRFKSSATTTGG
jgi:hypothetical protein